MILSKHCTYEPARFSLMVSIPDVRDLLDDLRRNRLTPEEVFEQTVDRILLGEDVPDRLSRNREFRVWVFQELEQLTEAAMGCLEMPTRRLVCH